MISVLDGQQGAPAPDKKGGAGKAAAAAAAGANPKAAHAAEAVSDVSGNALVLMLRVAGCEPSVWRRVVVREDMWLQQLHDVIQIAFDWFDYQTHVFEIGGAQYGNPFRSEALTIEDDRDVTLEDVDLAIYEKIFYHYNLGEGWHVEIAVEKTVSVAKGTVYPSCIAGGRAGPPEDCGSVEAYHDMLACLKEPHSDLGDEWREWLGPEYDSERCDLREINKGLAGICADNDKERGKG